MKSVVRTVRCRLHLARLAGPVPVETWLVVEFGVTTPVYVAMVAAYGDFHRTEFK